MVTELICASPRNTHGIRRNANDDEAVSAWIRGIVEIRDLEEKIRMEDASFG